MSELIGWMAAEAELPSQESKRSERRRHAEDDEAVRRLPRHQFGKNPDHSTGSGQALWQDRPEAEPAEPSTSESSTGEAVVQDDDPEVERERRIYRGRTVAMLRRYMRYSMETGRMPSILGREFFRAKVTSYTVTTFEDRVIFVHDMERCLDKLDEFSRDLIARLILQEHDRWATAKLLNCNEKTIRRLTPMILDVLSEILLDVGLLERSVPIREKPCQGGNSGPFSASDSEESKNKF